MSTKSDEVGRRGEVSRRENFWGRKEVEKTNNFGQGKMCFWFIPKTASTTSSSSGALVVAGSFQPYKCISQLQAHLEL
jgi:hypothetical protein